MIYKYYYRNYVINIEILYLFILNKIAHFGNHGCQWSLLSFAKLVQIILFD